MKRSFATIALASLITLGGATLSHKSSTAPAGHQIGGVVGYVFERNKEGVVEGAEIGGAVGGIIGLIGGAIVGGIPGAAGGAVLGGVAGGL